MWYLLVLCAHGGKQKPTQNGKIIWLWKDYPSPRIKHAEWQSKFTDHSCKVLEAFHTEIFNVNFPSACREASWESQISFELQGRSQAQALHSWAQEFLIPHSWPWQQQMVLICSGLELTHFMQPCDSSILGLLHTQPGLKHSKRIKIILIQKKFLKWTTKCFGRTEAGNLFSKFKQNITPSFLI